MNGAPPGACRAGAEGEGWQPPAAQPSSPSPGAGQRLGLFPVATPCCCRDSGALGNPGTAPRGAGTPADELGWPGRDSAGGRLSAERSPPVRPGERRSGSGPRLQRGSARWCARGPASHRAPRRHGNRRPRLPPAQCSRWPMGSGGAGPLPVPCVRPRPSRSGPAPLGLAPPPRAGGARAAGSGRRWRDGAAQRGLGAHDGRRRGHGQQRPGHRHRGE